MTSPRLCERRSSLVSICDLCSPSEREASRDPTRTKTAILGKTQNVARKNCHSATDCTDYINEISERDGATGVGTTHREQRVGVRPWREW